MHTKLVKFKNNTGFVKATNIGIREVERSSKYIILLNNDTEVTTGWERKLIKPLSNNPNVGAVGPITQSKLSWQEASRLNSRWKLSIPLFPKRGLVKDKISNYAELLSKTYGDQYRDAGKYPLSFFCVALRKKTFDTVGLLDEEFGIGFGDDDEYCHRLRTHGLKLLVSLGTFVYHWHRTTFNALNLPVASLQRQNSNLLKRKKKNE
jgi:GT2 family glycosyltransferase